MSQKSLEVRKIKNVHTPQKYLFTCNKFHNVFPNSLTVLNKDPLEQNFPE